MTRAEAEVVVAAAHGPLICAERVELLTFDEETGIGKISMTTGTRSQAWWTTSIVELQRRLMARGYSS